MFSVTITCLHSCTWQVLMAMYISNRNPQIGTPCSSKTSEPRPTKSGKGNLSPQVSHSTKLGLDKLTGTTAATSPFHVNVSLFAYISCLFNWATAWTAELISMIDCLNDKFSHRKVPFMGHVDMWSQMWVWLPQTSIWDIIFEERSYALRSGLKLVYKPNQSTSFHHQELRWCDSMLSTFSCRLNLTNSYRWLTGPKDLKF
jgi:hypothetical protein